MTMPSAFPESFHDKLIKFVFDNIRNVLICASLVTAAGAIYRFRDQMPFGGCFNSFLAIFLGAIAIVLLVWNLIHGGKKVLELWNAGSRTAILIAIPFLSVYMSVAFAIVWAIPRINAVGQAEHINSTSSSNTSLQATPKSGAPELPRWASPFPHTIA